MVDPDYTRDRWWENLPSVDGVRPATTRDTEPDADGLAYLADLQARLEERADDPDVQAFIRGELP